MPAYVIVDVDATNQARYDEYRQLSGAKRRSLQRSVHCARRRGGGAGGQLAPQAAGRDRVRERGAGQARVHLARIHRGA